ncbi:universal stress protein [Balneolaceae bacterium ANBcel3]|nr:universal stress protein [Balneolaceae bacterium ANBcel3]
MELPKTWMIATDGSQYADLSSRYASQLYKALPVKPDVWIVNVVSDPMNVGADGLEMEISQATKLLGKVAALFGEDGMADQNVRILVEVGNPRKKLVELLNKLKVDHLFMGGADFSSNAVDISSGGITNYMLHHLNGMVTIIK